MMTTKRGVPLLAIALWFSSSFPISAQSEGPPWYATVAIGTHAGTHVFDIATTGMALKNNPDAAESNPLLRPFANHLPVLATVDAALWTAANYGLWRMAKKHPRSTTALAIGLSVLEVAVGRHNLAVARRKQ